MKMKARSAAFLFNELSDRGTPTPERTQFGVVALSYGVDARPMFNNDRNESKEVSCIQAARFLEDWAEALRRASRGEE